MLRCIKADRQWVGDTSYVDTSAIGTVVNQQTHKPGRDVLSDNWYAVIAGTRVGIFTSWYVLVILSSFSKQTYPPLGSTLPPIPKALAILFIVLGQTSWTRSLVFSML
jgi:hypothetical protein